MSPTPRDVGSQLSDIVLKIGDALHFAAITPFDRRERTYAVVKLDKEENKKMNRMLASHND